MFCDYCGENIPSNVIYCPLCGKKLPGLSAQYNLDAVTPSNESIPNYEASRTITANSVASLEKKPVTQSRKPSTFRKFLSYGLVFLIVIIIRGVIKAEGYHLGFIGWSIFYTMAGIVAHMLAGGFKSSGKS